MLTTKKQAVRRHLCKTLFTLAAWPTSAVSAQSQLYYILINIQGQLWRTPKFHNWAPLEKKYPKSEGVLEVEQINLANKHAPYPSALGFSILSSGLVISLLEWISPLDTLLSLPL